MRIFNIHEAKTHFSKLINAVIHGNEIVIAIAGKPVAKLSPIKKTNKRKFGVLKRKIKIAKDFDAPLPKDVLDLFES